MGILLPLTLAACAAQQRTGEVQAVSLPRFALAPASFNHAVSLTQRLSFHHDADPEGPRSLEALLELDAASLRLAGFAVGQRVFTLVWDGHTLEESRAPQLPADLHSGRIVSDIQLVYWPAEVLRSALPAGWVLEDSPGRRALLRQGRAWVTIRYDADPRWTGRAELLNSAEHYRLIIDSRLND